jgi:AhpD family alkylhydroperoxidase
MSRSDTERDIRETLGQIPDFFKEMPDDALAREWAQWKEFQLQDTAISAREKQLIGFAVAAAIHCPYCTYFHRSATTMMGTTREQLEEAARMAADTAKYSTYLHGLEVPIEDFKKQSDEMGEYVAAHQPQEAGRRAA